MTRKQPGKRWRKVLLAPAALAMVAGGAFIVDAALEETKDPSPPADPTGGVAGAAPCGPDAYGYTCDGRAPYQLVDVSGTGRVVASGDDVSGLQPLRGAGTFRFYGVTYTALTAATNGYLSTDPTDGGPDLSNDCPLPAMLGTGGGARLYPLHDDTLADIYYQYFASCPRPADRGGDQGCHVFTWDNVSHFGGGGPWRQEVLLYEETSDFTFQIGPGNPEQGAGSTTGAQRDGGAVGLTWACNAPGSVPDETAVTFFNPEVAVPAVGGWGVGVLAVVLLAVGVGAVRAGRSRVGSLTRCL